MTPDRFLQLTHRYAGLRLAVVGDFCLDRYFDVDPARQELSIETGLPVHNVIQMRCQPGAAGTILNNLVALGVGSLWPVGVAGEDGEGWELLRSLRRLPGVNPTHFLQSADRHTFTYSKPLLHHPDRPPEELSRLDTKNWTPTPDAVSAELVRQLDALAGSVDAVIVMDQVDLAETGVITAPVRERLGRLALERPELPIVADSRRSLRGFPPVIFKMNATELARFAGQPVESLPEIQAATAQLARTNGRPVFVTLAERGIVGADPTGTTYHRPALPVRGPIDIVGAGDAVTANLTAALAAGAELPEAMELAMAGANRVIHQLGTTGTASIQELAALLFSAP
jgi:rfaE bifunctional protein kinase chain/domain